MDAQLNLLIVKLKHPGQKKVNNNVETCINKNSGFHKYLPFQNQFTEVYDTMH